MAAVGGSTGGGQRAGSAFQPQLRHQVLRSLSGHAKELGFYLNCVRQCGWLNNDTLPLKQGCQTHFHQEPHQPWLPSKATKGPNVISGLHKCNYSLTRGKELGAAAE